VVSDDISRLEEELGNTAMHETSSNALQLTSGRLWRTAKQETSDLSKSLSTRVLPLSTRGWRTTRRSYSGGRTTDLSPRTLTYRTDRWAETREDSRRLSSGSLPDDTAAWETIGPSTMSPRRTASPRGGSRTVTFRGTERGSTVSDDDDDLTVRDRAYAESRRGRQGSDDSDTQVRGRGSARGKGKEVRKRNSRGGR
jgi:hypothetical protein